MAGSINTFFHNRQNNSQSTSGINSYFHNLAHSKRKQNEGGVGGGIGYTLGKAGTGALGILEGATDYTVGGIAKLFGQDEYAEQLFANDKTGSLNAQLDNWYNPSNGMQMVGDVASGIGNSLVGVGVVAGASVLSGGTLTPLAASIVSGATIGLGSAGMSTAEAYKKTGQLGAKEFGYGALSGITEAGLESVSGAAGNVGAKLFAKKTAETVAKSSILKGIAKSFAGEAFEEGMSEILDPYFQRWTGVDPEAKNATIQEIGYAALIGGISGALLDGVGSSANAIRSTVTGNKIVNAGQTNIVLDTAKEYAKYQEKNNTNNKAYQEIKSMVDEYESLEAKNASGTPNVRQRRLLGDMQTANTVLAFSPAVEQSKARILANSEEFANYLNGLNIKMEDGSIFKTSAEELRNNEALLTRYAVSDALGHILMDSKSVYDLTMSGDAETVQNKFIGGELAFMRFKEDASDAEIKEISNLLGIDVKNATYEQYIDKLKTTPANVFEDYRDTLASMTNAKRAVGEAKVKKTDVPVLSDETNISDGISVFKDSNGNYFAIIKEGKNYRIYQDGKLTKELNKKTLNSLLFTADETENQAKTEAKADKEVKKTDTARETVEKTAADAYARKNVKGYDELSERQKIAVRWTIMSGKANGVSDDVITAFARISADTKTNIGFAEGVADGITYTNDGEHTIYLNANGTRTVEKGVMHELTHAMKGTDGYAELQALAEQYFSTHESEYNEIKERYETFYKKNNLAFTEDILSDELTAHFVEKQMESRKVLTRMTEDDPSFTKKCLSFLQRIKSHFVNGTKADADMSNVERRFLSVYNAYKARQQGKANNKKFALPDTVEEDVIKKFGKTYRWAETGYILKDGTRIDFSGKNDGAPGGYRTVDHREISTIYEDEDISGANAMIEFMSRGNIRVMPETPGINLQVEPTEEQYRQIGDLVERLGWKEKEFIVDFDDSNGNTVDSLSYEGNVSWRKVVSDIRYYFKEGKVPYQSDLSKFRYALPETDSKGRKLSERQRFFFRDSKVVDDKGRLLEVYHATNNYEEKRTWNEEHKWYDTKYTPFTVFKKTYREQAGHFFGKDIDNAGGYGSRIYKVYLNLKNPLIIDCKGANYADITFNGLNKDTYEWAAYADKKGYDGVIFKNIRDGVDYGDLQNPTDEYVAFRPWQIKSTDNTNPTLDYDIRFALREGIDLNNIVGGDRAMTELPQDRLTLRDVVTDKSKVNAFKSQVSGDAKRFTEGWQIMFTNAQAGLERVIKSAGIKEATAKTNYVRAAKYAGMNAIDEEGGQYALDGEKRVGDSLVKIWSPIYKGQKLGENYKKNPTKNAKSARYEDYQQKFNLYLLHQHNVDRYAEGKMVLGEDITPEVSEREIAKMDEAYPEFRAVAEKTWKFTDNLLQLAVDSGMYSQEYVDNLREMYPHYVPTYREEHMNGVRSIFGSRDIAVNADKKRAKGADTRVLPIDDIIARMTIQRYSSSRINKLLVDLADGLEKNNVSSDDFRIIASEDTDLDMDNGQLVDTKKTSGGYQVTFYRNGKRVTAEVSKNVFSGIDAFAPSGDTTFHNVLLDGVAKVNTTFKKLVTSLNPFFSYFRNPLRDIQDAGLYTRYPLRIFAKNYARARQEITSNGMYWQEAKAAGITSASVFDYEKGITTKQKNKVQRIIDRIEATSNTIEMMPRLAEYISAREAGKNVQEALLEAQDVTTNFGRGGVFAKKLNSTIMPFLNPAIQGFSKMVRAYTGKDAAQSYVNLIIRSIMLGIGMAALNDLMNDDDEDYQDLSEYIKETNYVLSIGNGEFIKIPKGRVVGVLGEVYLRSKWYLQGDKKAYEGFLKSISQQVTPVDNFSRTIFSPIMDLKNNKTWYGGAIESQKWENTKPSDRYDESTSSIAIWLGKVFDYSPLKINYLLDQYGGVVTDIVLPATSTQAETGIVSQNMLVNSITNSKWSSKFYDTLEEYNYKKTDGDSVAAGVVKYLNGIRSTISDMNKQISEIQQSNLSDDEKIKQEKVIQAAINALEKDALTNAKYLEEELKKYSLSDETFDADWRDAVSTTIGEDYALSNYNKDVYNKAKALSTGGIGMGTYYDYYFDVKKIDSDKKANGEAISGSKKAKVIAYTWQLNIPDVQKLMLIMSSGYKITDGDINGINAVSAQRSVAQHIVSLNISKEEKLELAKACGLSVVNNKIVIKK